jgi:hypothetical protein
LSVGSGLSHSFSFGRRKSRFFDSAPFSRFAQDDKAEGRQNLRSEGNGKNYFLNGNRENLEIYEDLR